MVIRMALSLTIFIIGIAAGFGSMSTMAKASVGATDWIQTPVANIRLVSAVAGIGDTDNVPLGLQFKLAEGWKIYWRTPGDAGFPPDIKIKTSVNLEGIDWQWPLPQRFSLFGQESLGYAGDVVFPITAQLTTPGKPLAIQAVVHALACSEICVPLDAELSFTLPAGPAGPTVYTQLVSRYRSQVPSLLAGVGLSVTSVEHVGAPKSLSIKVAISSDQPLTAPDVFVEAGIGYAFGKPTIEISDDRLNAYLTVPVSSSKTEKIDSLPVTLTIIDGDRFIETSQTVGASSVTQTGITTKIPFQVWMAMLGLGLLGGFILNFMPCVLPVLSLKLLEILRYGGEEIGSIRRSFIASALGIMSCFLLLAGGAIAMKQAGLAVGWGIQFQQPLFLATMIVLVTGFAVNLFGWLEIPLPRAFAYLGALRSTKETLGVSTRGTQGLFSHFLTGALAALLATPCSAPFLGTALGFALSQGPMEIFTVFGALGIGLALPYLLVAMQPSLVRRLPRPGAWMDRLRVVLGFGLLATAIWLLNVASEQLSTFQIASIILLLSSAGLILAITKTSASRLPSLLAGIFAVSVLVVVGLAGQRSQNESPSAAETAEQNGPGVNWNRFEATRLANLVEKGRLVFVDVTAAWCLTCKVNKSLVLDRGEVLSRLKHDDITAMRADWTKPNRRIAAYLASFQRYGIPFNAVYGPSAPKGIALPELLTTEAVLQALDQASAPNGAAKRTASVIPSERLTQ